MSRSRIALVALAALSLLGTLLVAAPAGAAAGTPNCAGHVATIVGTNASETINGTSGDDVIVGLGGHDFINGRGGNDIICGGPGNDTIFGGGGRDIIRGGNGSDVIDGGGSKDRIFGNNGNDVLIGRSGRDKMRGQAGWDEMRGGPGPDRCTSGEYLVGCETGTAVLTGYETTPISPGDTGQAVKYLQWKLTAADLYRGPINGRYPNDPWELPGTMTSAVYAFHKLYRSPVGVAYTPSDHVDGEWTVEDWDRLADFVPEIPVARAGNPDRFEVDTVHELMWLIRDGEVEAIFHVSVGFEDYYYWSGTGKQELAHTPRGDLDVIRYDLVKYRTQGWMHRAWYYDPGNVSEHSHRWLSMHGYYTVPPYPASHGCVRVTYDDADWIYSEIGPAVGMDFHIWDG